MGKIKNTIYFYQFFMYSALPLFKIISIYHIYVKVPYAHFLFCAVICQALILHISTL